MARAKGWLGVKSKQRQKYAMEFRNHVVFERVSGPGPLFPPAINNLCNIQHLMAENTHKREYFTLWILIIYIQLISTRQHFI